MGFVVYDLETSGLHKRFDQILQFAAIHTDDELEPIDTPLHIRARLLPSILPSPKALLITGLTIEEIIDPTVPSLYNAVCEIHEAFLRWSPSMYLGFNSIRFDEEFLRQAFYQNLRHPIYVTSVNNNRGDVLRLARAVALLNPGALTIPLSPEGRRSFRLSDIGQANGIRFDRSHDALSDAQTTLALCRLIRDRAPDAWSNFSRFANRRNVVEFVQEEEAFALLDDRADSDFVCVTLVSKHSTDRNLHYCLDLATDMDSLGRLSNEELCVEVSRRDGPIRKLRANASPVMAQLWELEEQSLLPAPSQDIEHVAQRVRSDEEFLQRLSAAIQASQSVWPTSEHVEEQIYDDFIGDADGALCQQFHLAQWPERPNFIGRFGDRRLRRLAQRLLLHERPDLLDQHRLSALLVEVQRRLDGSITDAPWTTLPKVAAEIQALSAGCSEGDRRILDGLSNYLANRFP